MYNVDKDWCNFTFFFQRIDLSPFSTQQCSDVLIKKGFYKKESDEDTVPEEFQNGPYIEKDEL